MSHLTIIKECDDCGGKIYAMITVEPPTEKHIEVLRSRAGACGVLYKTEVPSYTIIELKDE